MSSQIDNNDVQIQQAWERAHDAVRAQELCDIVEEWAARGSIDPEQIPTVGGLSSHLKVDPLRLLGIFQDRARSTAAVAPPAAFDFERSATSR